MIKTLIRRLVGYDELLDRIKQTDEKVAYLRDDCYDEFNRRGGPPKWLIGRRISVADLNANAIKARPIQTPLPNVKKLEWTETEEGFVAHTHLGRYLIVHSHGIGFALKEPYPSLAAYRTLREAKDYAQEEHNRKVLTLLEEVA